MYLLWTFHMWRVFWRTVFIIKKNRQAQVDQFRCMLDKHGHAINRNYRKANPVPPGNNTRPYLVVLDAHGSNSTHGDVVEAEVIVAAATRSRSSGIRQTSRRRSLAVIASAKDGDSSRTLCVKPTKTQLLRRMFNLNKISVPKHWPTAKTISIRNSRQSKHAQRADIETEDHLRPTLSFNATRPSWK